MRASVPSTKYCSICNVLNLWSILFICTDRIYRLYDGFKELCTRFQLYFLQICSIKVCSHCTKNRTACKMLHRFSSLKMLEYFVLGTLAHNRTGLKPDEAMRIHRVHTAFLVQPNIYAPPTNVA